MDVSQLRPLVQRAICQELLHFFTVQGRRTYPNGSTQQWETEHASVAAFCSALLSCSRWYRQELLLILVGMVYFYVPWLVSSAGSPHCRGSSAAISPACVSVEISRGGCAFQRAPPQKATDQMVGGDHIQNSDFCFRESTGRQKSGR